MSEEHSLNNLRAEFPQELGGYLYRAERDGSVSAVDASGHRVQFSKWRDFWDTAQGSPPPFQVSGGQVVVKAYRGTQSEATRRFQQDAAQMAANGYVPVSQTWAAGEWSTGAFVIAVLLILFFGLGLLILGYLLVVKPPGALTVTYEMRTTTDEKTCPMCAEKVKAAALVCRFCGHRFAD